MEAQHRLHDQKEAKGDIVSEDWLFILAKAELEYAQRIIDEAKDKPQSDMRTHTRSAHLLLCFAFPFRGFLIFDIAVWAQRINCGSWTQ